MCDHFRFLHVIAITEKSNVNYLQHEPKKWINQVLAWAVVQGRRDVTARNTMEQVSFTSRVLMARMVGRRRLWGISTKTIASKWQLHHE